MGAAHVLVFVGAIEFGASSAAGATIDAAAATPAAVRARNVRRDVIELRLRARKRYRRDRKLPIRYEIETYETENPAP